MLIQIKHKITDEVLYEHDCPNNTIKLTIEVAIKAEANLRGADLSLANLSKADLSIAYLTGANLTRADLSGANLSGADLFGADLSGANLSGANLTGVYLTRANLTGANMEGLELIILKYSKNYYLVGTGDWYECEHIFTGPAKEAYTMYKLFV